METVRNEGLEVAVLETDRGRKTVESGTKERVLKTEKRNFTKMRREHATKLPFDCTGSVPF